MSDITIGVIIGGVIVFFLQWAGRHFLDRLVLPKVLDWWATFSKKTALNRAELLLKTFESDMKAATNIPLFVLRLEQRQIRLGTIPQAINLLLLLAIFVHQLIPEQPSPSEPTKLVIGVLLVVALSSVSLIFENTRDNSVFADLSNYRDRTVIRLEALFRASGLDEDEIRNRIECVPPAPHPAL